MAMSAFDAEKISHSSALFRKLNVGELLKQAELDAVTLASLSGGLASGYAMSSELDLNGVMDHTDSFKIGTDEYQLIDVATAANVTITDAIGIEIGDDDAATYANILAAVNGTALVANAAVKQKLPSTEAAPGRGTKAVTASITGTVLKVFRSTAQGNGVPGGSASDSLALTQSGLAAWSYANLNSASALPAERKIVVGEIALTAPMVTAGAFRVELPFTPTSLFTEHVDSSGNTKTMSNDKLAINGAGLDLTLNVDTLRAAPGNAVLAAGVTPTNLTVTPRQAGLSVTLAVGTSPKALTHGYNAATGVITVDAAVPVDPVVVANVGDDPSTLTITPKKAFTLVIVDPGGDSALLHAYVAATDTLTVTLAYGTGAITTTVAQLADLLMQEYGWLIESAVPETGADLCAAVASTPIPYAGTTTTTTGDVAGLLAGTYSGLIASAVAATPADVVQAVAETEIPYLGDALVSASKVRFIAVK